MTSSLYIHIPFCATKCSYCSFNSYAGLEVLQERYVDAVCAEMTDMALRGLVEPLRTVFLGGGDTISFAQAFITYTLQHTFRAFFPCQGCRNLHGD